MLEHEGTVTVYSNGQVIGRIYKERQGPFWLLDEDLQQFMDMKGDAATYAQPTVEETIKTIEKAIERREGIKS